MNEETKRCPRCGAVYGAKVQVCKHCPERLVYIDTGELVPLVEVAVPPHYHEDITHWYTHVHVYLDGVELKNHCQYADVARGIAIIDRYDNRKYVGTETLYGDVSLVFGKPT